MSLGIVAASHVPFAATDYASEVLADSPLVYYRLGESSGLWQDSSGNGRHTTDESGTVTRSATGLLASGDDGCVEFNDDESQYISTSDAAWMDVSTVTMECWVQTSYSGGPQGLFGRWRSASAASYQLDLQADGRVRFYIWAGGAQRTAEYDCDPSDGDPHHIVGTYDGTTLRLYFDGSEVATTSYSGSIASVATSLILGNREVEIVGANSSKLRGKLDEVALYSTALSSTRVAAHYNAGT